MSNNTLRYHIITDKNPREILMLRGSGCKWRRCAFCDYHLDYSTDADANYQLNLAEIQKVTGLYQKLEVINSGSFCDLDDRTMTALRRICEENSITEIHFETHWMHRMEIAALRESFRRIGVAVKMKIGTETFDEVFREQILKKGMPGATPADIASYCDEVCLLFGIAGQTLESMEQDLKAALTYFERTCVNVMVANTTDILPDTGVIQTFIKHLYPLYKDNPRVDILLNNTDFGVGGENYDE